MQRTLPRLLHSRVPLHRWGEWGRRSPPPSPSGAQLQRRSLSWKAKLLAPRAAKWMGWKIREVRGGGGGCSSGPPPLCPVPWPSLLSMEHLVPQALSQLCLQTSQTAPLPSSTLDMQVIAPSHHTLSASPFQPIAPALLQDPIIIYLYVICTPLTFPEHPSLLLRCPHKIQT